MFPRADFKMMRCQWFCRPGETLLSNHCAAISVAEHPREVFLDESGWDENFMTTIGWSPWSNVLFELASASRIPQILLFVCTTAMTSVLKNSLEQTLFRTFTLIDWVVAVEQCVGL